MSTTPLPPLHRTVLLVAGLVVIAAGLHAAAATVNLVLVSLLVAMSVSPIPGLLGRRGVNHGLAVLLTVAAVVVGGVLLLAALGSGLAGLQAKLPEYQAALTGLAGSVSTKLAARGIDLQSVIHSDTERAVALIGGLVRGSLGALAYGFLALILVVLILLETPARTEAGTPATGLRGKYEAVGEGVRRFVALTGMIGAGQSAANLLVMLLLGTDFALVWAVLFFLLSFVPFGFVIGLIPPLAVTLLEQGPARAGILTAVLLMANLVSDNVVKPKLMGSGLGLSPLVIVLSLMGWGFVLGAMGALLAVPLTIALTTVGPEVMGGAARTPPSPAGPA